MKIKAIFIINILCTNINAQLHKKRKVMHIKIQMLAKVLVTILYSLHHIHHHHVYIYFANLVYQLIELRSQIKRQCHFGRTIAKMLNLCSADLVIRKKAI